MTPWSVRPMIDVDLSLPATEQAAALSDRAVAAARALLDTIMAGLPVGATLLADAVRLRTAGRFHAQAVAFARRADVDWRSVMLANISYDLVMSQFGCSTAALATPDGPVLARNLDWPNETQLARATFGFRSLRDGKVDSICAGFPGLIGVVSGMSVRGGFALVLNAVPGGDAVDKTGYPVLLHLRRVLDDAADFDAALQSLTQTHLAAPALVTLVGRENHQRVVIERGPKRFSLRKPSGDGPLVTTNHYRQLDAVNIEPKEDYRQNTCGRFEAVSSFCDRKLPADKPVDDAALLYILSDPSVMQPITAQHVIFRPSRADGRVYVPRKLLGAVDEPN